MSVSNNFQKNQFGTKDSYNPNLTKPNKTNQIIQKKKHAGDSKTISPVKVTKVNRDDLLKEMPLDLYNKLDPKNYDLQPMDECCNECCQECGSGDC